VQDLAIIAFWIILMVAAFETGLSLLIKKLRKDFQWLITAEDEVPIFPSDLLKRFFDNSFDPELGWVTKANTQVQERGGTVGEQSGQYKKSTYHINGQGCRMNPGYEDCTAIISTYGDSFVFSRQVEDDETWQHFLSRLSHSNVLNFGAGNYGFDQALLRLKREYERNPTPVVIIGVVPETIVRILSVWKHYSEYGNILAFKPRFEINNGGLTVIRNVIDSQDKFGSFREYLPHLQEHDYFYKNKFRRDILRFPYLFSIMRNCRRNVPLITSLTVRKILPAMGIEDPGRNRPWKMVLERNFTIVRNLYRSPCAVDLFLKILEDFAVWGRKKGFHPVFLLMPYLHDLLYIKEQECYYAKFVTQAREILQTIDLTEPLLNMDSLDTIYAHDFYGGHLSRAGNEFIARIIADHLAEYIADFKQMAGHA